jgi:hypothetical protein
MQAFENQMSTPQKWKVPALSRGVITLGNVPSRYTGKFMPGFYAACMCVDKSDPYSFCVWMKNLHPPGEHMWM